jgi:hypothetical protein
VLGAQGDLAGALPLCERALALGVKALGHDHPDNNRKRCNLSRLFLRIGSPTQAHTVGETALTADNKVLRPDHPWTKDSARVTADALDALGRAEEAKALRERYGIASSDDPKPS